MTLGQLPSQGGWLENTVSSSGSHSGADPSCSSWVLWHRPPPWICQWVSSVDAPCPFSLKWAGCLDEGFHMDYTENSSFSQSRQRCAHTESLSGWALCASHQQQGECHEDLGLRWRQVVAEGQGIINLPSKIASNLLQKSNFTEGQRKSSYPPPIPWNDLVLDSYPAAHTEPVSTCKFYYLKRNWSKVSSQALFTSWLSFPQQIWVLGGWCYGAEGAVKKAKGMVEMLEVANSCPAEMTHAAHLESQRGVYNPEPFCLNRLCLFEQQPSCPGLVKVCICWGLEKCVVVQS